MRFRSILLAAALAIACARAAAPQLPPAALRIDPFYSRYVDADGISVIASARVPPKAIRVRRSAITCWQASPKETASAKPLHGERLRLMLQPRFGTGPQTVHHENKAHGVWFQRSTQSR